MPDYKNEFISYRGASDRRINSKFGSGKALYENLQKLLSSVTEADTNALEDYFSKNNTSKVKARNVLLDFNEYLKSRNKTPIDLSFLDGRIFYEHDIERRLSVLKYLHEEHKTADISEHYSIGDDAASRYIKAYREGFRFFDTEIKVDMEVDKWKHSCRSSVHPFFLALNASELSALMKLLKDEKNPLVHRIGNLMYSQMTDYAKEKICPFTEGVFEEIELKYLEEYEMPEDWVVGYLEKCNMAHKDEPIEFLYYQDGQEKVSKGYFRKFDYKNKTIFIETLDSQMLEIEFRYFRLKKNLKEIYR